MKKKLPVVLVLILMMIVAACGGNNPGGDNGAGAGGNTGGSNGGNDGAPAAASAKDTITMVWNPNESGVELKEAREEFSRIIAEATGKKVEHQTTTDYIIAIEAIVNGNADIAYMGAQGYVEANAKNPKVQALFVHSGESGTLEDAVYYSWLAVRKGEEGEYMSGSDYSMDNIAGKAFSFVSNSSTSGFKVPSSGIVSHFGNMEQYSGLTNEDLLQGGSDKLFSEVLFGGSHQGSAINLLTGKADVAAFCDTCVNNYVELVSGDANRPGAVYRVKEGAEDPFQSLEGEQFVLISVTPVLNQPFAVNGETIGAEDQEKIRNAFTSDAVTNNEKIFLPQDGEGTSIFKKTSGNEKFVPVDDAFYDPVRELSAN